MDEKRVRVRVARLGHDADSFGTSEVYVGARVMAPFRGSQKKFPGSVVSANWQEGTVHVVFDDGDEDHDVKVAAMVFAKGAQAKLPVKRKDGRAQTLRMQPKARKLRLAAPSSKARGPGRAGSAVERDWVMHKVVALSIKPPCSGEQDYDNVDDRMILKYQWLYVGESQGEDVPFPANLIGQISLRDIIKADDYVCGMYLVALRHFCMDMASGHAMSAITVANIFGRYDPIEH